MKVNGSKTGLVLAGIVFVGLAGVSATAASFQGLGDLPGGWFGSWARGVSADGSVVVGGSNSGWGGYFYLEAFRWEGGEMVGLGDLPGGDFSSYAHGVSADGSVVVGCSESATATYEAFRWSEASGMVSLGGLPGGDFYSEAFGVSADGSVVVGASDSALTSGYDYEAFRWTDLNGNGLVDPNEKLDYHPEFGLGDLPGGSFHSLALGVSADGSVVVGASNSASSSPGNEAFRWEGGEMVGLGDLPGGWFESVAEGVSADGSVVVGASYSALGHGAFRWEGGEMVGLGDLPGGGFLSYARGVSADGSVVVGQYYFWGFNAFIWDAANGVRSLKDVLEDDFGLDLTGWTLKEATSISDDGTTIVGHGINPSGDYEAWIATLTCDYDLAGDMNDDCRVSFKDFAQLGAGWQISYDMLDLKEMAADWLINCHITPGDPACIPK